MSEGRAWARVSCLVRWGGGGHHEKFGFKVRWGFPRSTLYTHTILYHNTGLTGRTG